MRRRIAEDRCARCGAEFDAVGPRGTFCANGHARPTPPPPNGRADPPAEPVAVARLLSDMVPQVVRWLWDRRLPLGKLSLLDGDPGLGKSTLLLDVAARVTRGDVLPDGSVSELDGPAGVVILQAEDGWEDTILPRFLAAGGVPSRVAAFTDVREPAETGPDGRERRPARLRMPHLGDVGPLETLVRDMAARLVIVDPLVAFLPPRVDANKDAEVRQGLAPIAALAERTGCAIVGVRHLNKAAALQALYRGGGSIGIIGAARSGLLVAAHPDDPRRRILAPLKCNLAVFPPALEWSLESAVGGVATVHWAGISDLTAERLLEGGDREERQAGSEAEVFLRDELAQGERPATDLIAAARRMGIATRTLRRAADALGVRKQRRGFGRGSALHWSLPEHLAVAANAAAWAASC